MMEARRVVEELKRELQTRRDFYPKWIMAGRIDARTAAHRIDCIASAIALIEPLVKPEVPEPQEPEQYELPITPEDDTNPGDDVK
jgi:hypothetical protein